MNTTGLRMDQAPPLAVPMAFFAVTPLALVAAGALLAWDGAAAVATSWHPRTFALVHLGTLGLLGAAMLGALYQLVPVVLGAAVPAVRLAWLVLAALVVGVAGLVTGLATSHATWTAVGGGALALALLAFLAPITVALVRAPGGGETRTGIRVAVAALAVMALLGLRLAWGHATGALPPSRVTLLAGHAALGLVAWVGGLIAAVSWQVVPMFYLTAAFPRRRARGVVVALAVTVTLVALAVLLDLPPWQVALAAAPGAVAVWLVEPWTMWQLLAGRKRKRPDPSLDYWRLGLALAPLTLLVAGLALATEWSQAPLLFGWLAIWGHAGGIVHGMLTRIVPFLVWFGRFTVDPTQPVRPMKQLLPDRQVRVGLWLHAGTVALGAVAVTTGLDLLARATGAGLVATGLWLAGELASVAWRVRR